MNFLDWFKFIHYILYSIYYIHLYSFIYLYSLDWKVHARSILFVTVCIRLRHGQALANMQRGMFSEAVEAGELVACHFFPLLRWVGFDTGFYPEAKGVKMAIGNHDRFNG